MERSFFTGQCFMDVLRRDGNMTVVEYSILKKWSDWIRQHSKLAVDLIGEGVN